MSEAAQKTFTPSNKKQKAFIESAALEILYSGAVGAGKSRAICEKGHILNLLYPGNKGLIVRKENSALRRTTLKTLLEEVIPPSHIVSVNQMDGVIKHRTGVQDADGNEILSEIHWAGLDKAAGQDYPTKILSTQFGWIAVDEAIELKKEDWDVLLTRLRFMVPNLSREINDRMPRQIFGATNPDGPNHWLYERFFMSDSANRKVVLATPYDNPHLPRQYVEQLEENLVGLTRERLLFGKWVQSEGVIYKNFNPATMVIEKKDLLPLSEYKAFIVGADSNFPLPRAAVFIGIRGDGYRDVIDEFYVENAHIEQLKTWITTWHERVHKTISVYHDPSDAHAISSLRAPGIMVFKANNQVVPGISSVSYYVDKGLLRITNNCPNLIREMQTYRWSKNKEGSTPDKTEDHAVDALRYGLHSEKKGMLRKPTISI